MSKIALLSLLHLAGWLSGSGEEGEIIVPSHKIKQPQQRIEPSKQKLKRKEGKKSRRNRGKNRGK